MPKTTKSVLINSLRGIVANVAESTENRLEAARLLIQMEGRKLAGNEKGKAAHKAKRNPLSDLIAAPTRSQ